MRAGRGGQVSTARWRASIWARAAGLGHRRCVGGQEANPGPGLSAARYDPAGTSGEQYRPKDARHLHIWPCRICSQ